MSQLTTYLRSLGNPGAVANVRLVLEARRREEWVIEGLSRRLDPAAQDTTQRAA
jgi:hypothetical protein